MNNTDRLIFAFAVRQHFLITRKQAFDLGLSRDGVDWRVESGFLQPVHHEVYRVADTPQTRLQRIMAATLAGGEGAIASHETARALWGLPGAKEIGPIHVTIPRGHDYTVPGVIAHESRNLHAADITRLHGIPVTTADRAAFDLAFQLDPIELLDLIDDITGRSLATAARMKARSRELGGRGVAGTRKFRKVLDVWIEDGKVSMTKFERGLFRIFDAADIPRPTPQFVVKTPAGVKKFDFAYPDDKLGIEAHSRKFHGEELVKAGDIDRQNVLTATGYRVLYVRWRDVVYRPDWVIEIVAEARRNSSAA